MNKYNELRTLYKEFIYEKYEIEDNCETYRITYFFNIPGLSEFRPTLEVPKFEINDFSSNLVFHIGLVELISYWKCACPEKIIIKAGYINREQINWFKKLYYYGLGELFYTNGIEADYDTFMDIVCVYPKKNIEPIKYKGKGNLIPIGGGKDSNVTLEILRNDYDDNDVFVINPKKTILECIEVAGYSNKLATVRRTIDKNLLELNKQGFINGHTPFSAIVAFISYLVAYSMGKKYIVLSNESSANESNVEGTKINHQYSKTYEFENDFNYYTNKYFNIDIKYFSLLRPLSEFQIALLFSKYEKYHQVFKSCNVGSKSDPWQWCLNCPKCLFVYIILSPFLYKDKLVKIFGEDLYEREDLLETFIKLTGYGYEKPFECVGTYEEVRYAISLIINNLGDDLPYLLKYYKNHYKLEDLSSKLETQFNNEHNLDDYFLELLEKELDRYV